VAARSAVTHLLGFDLSELPLALLYNYFLLGNTKVQNGYAILYFGVSHIIITTLEVLNFELLSQV
jgi:hypothetical protein